MPALEFIHNTTELKISDLDCDLVNEVVSRSDIRLKQFRWFSASSGKQMMHLNFLYHYNKNSSQHNINNISWP